jgi:hypothetical protein
VVSQQARTACFFGELTQATRALKLYARRIEDACLALLDRALGYPLEKRNFRKNHGYELDLNNPQSFNQKICWKKIHDRNPLLPVLADKYKVRDYITSTLGKPVADQVLIPLLVATDDPDSLSFDRLPDSFVIKSSHGSGCNLLVHDKRTLDRSQVVARCRSWLKTSYGVRAHEWAYQHASKKILVEPMLKNRDGSIPSDYKCSMFHGKCGIIQVDFDRFEAHTRSLYDPQWNKIDAQWKWPRGGDVPRPERLDEMLRLAEILAGSLDFVRVDFYLVDGRLFVGELTHYPERGRGRFTPREFDFELGRLWSLPIERR